MIETGLSFTSHALVDEPHTAAVMGSGDLPVLATPALIALMENAAMKAVAPHLPEGSTTVGTRMEADHLKPSLPGTAISATATLTAVDGRKLTFDVSASDGTDCIGRGTHVRFIVDRERFLAKMR